MKKNIFVLLVTFVLLMSIAAIAIAAGTGEWIKVKPTMNDGGSGVASSMTKNPAPTIWFSYWGQTGSYNVRFYGENIEPSYRARIYVDGVRKGEIMPQRTFTTNSNASAALIDLKQLTGQTAIYEPGIHHTEVRVYISKKTYYSYTLNNLDVPYFDAGISNISADPNTVYIRYYLQPIFITISAGESANVTVGDFYQNTISVQADQWGYYFIEIGIPLADYQNKMQNQQVPTTIEVQGYIKELQAYYWQPY